MIEKIQSLLSHIENVQNFCKKIAFHYIEHNKGDRDLQFARQLLSNAQVHDNSKFHGIEFKALTNKWNDPEQDKKELELAVAHHQAVNRHHPESFGSIHDMPDVYLVECVCDWAARSKEQGTNIREWLETVGMQKYLLTTNSNVYRKINNYLDILEL